MDLPELSLSPLISTFTERTNNSCLESETSYGRKRKFSSWEKPSTQTSIDLQLNDPLPLDWEQCLDLQSGKMYYLNRRSLEKSWVKPREQRLDLDLNMSHFSASERKKQITSTQKEAKKESSSCSGMVAIVCLNCHLLVMLYRSSPSCPNCKYMHSLQPSMSTQTTKAVNNSPETLSLLH